jgi:hypothetical protein
MPQLSGAPFGLISNTSTVKWILFSKWIKKNPPKVHRLNPPMENPGFSKAGHLCLTALLCFHMGQLLWIEWRVFISMLGQFLSCEMSFSAFAEGLSDASQGSKLNSGMKQVSMVGVKEGFLLTQALPKGWQRKHCTHVQGCRLLPC